MTIAGHGESGKPLQPEFYADGDRWADELAAVIQAAGLRRPVVVGWSLGGAIVSHYLRRHGDQTLAGVAFVGAVTSYAPEYFEPATGRIVGGLMSDRLEERIPATRTFLDTCFASRLDGEARETMLAYNAMVPSRAHAAIQRLTLDDSGAILRGIGVPVLVIHGAKDRLVRVAMSQRAAALAPRSELILYPDAGHGPMIDAPAALNRDSRHLPLAGRMMVQRGSKMDVQPFRIAIPDAVLDDLRRRLARVRWPDEVAGSGWTLGADLGYMQGLIAYWRDDYDWRAQEARLNRLAQFRAPVGRQSTCTSSTRSAKATRPIHCSCRTAGRARSSSCRN
ncbi:MAG: alpha/beta fold hydrolase [Sphingomonas sp.]